MEKFLLSLLCLLTVGFAGRAETWTKITSTSDINATDEYIIVSNPGKSGKVDYYSSVMKYDFSGIEVDESTSVQDEITTANNYRVIVQFEILGNGYYIYTVKENKKMYLNFTYTIDSKNKNKAAISWKDNSNDASIASVSFENELVKVTTVGPADPLSSLQSTFSNGPGGVKGTINFKGYATTQKPISIYKKVYTSVDPSKQDAIVSFGEASKKNFEILDTDLSFTEPELTKTEGITVNFDSSDTNIATVSEDGKVTLTGNLGSTTITAAFDGDETYNGASDSYTITVVHACENIKDFMAIGNGNQSLIGFPMTVAFVHGKNIFATDEAGDFIQIYGENSYKVNDVIPAGWTGKYTIFNSVTPEIEPIGALPLSDETNMFVPKSISASEIGESLVNNIFVVKNVVFANATPSSKDNFLGVSDNIELTFRNNYEFAGVEAGKYDVTVLGNVYAPKDGDKQFQLYMISFAAAPAVPEIVCDHSIENGVLTVNAESTTLNFKKVDGIDIYYRVNSRNTPAMTRACDDISHSSLSWVQHDGEDIPLTKDHESIEYFACNPTTGAHSDTNKIMLDISTGVAEIEAAEAGKVRWFDMQGREVKGQPAAGVYVRVANGKATKVIVK